MKMIRLQYFLVPLGYLFISSKMNVSNIYIKV